MAPLTCKCPVFIYNVLSYALSEVDYCRAPNSHFQKTYTNSEISDISIWENLRSNAPSILGTSTFNQVSLSIFQRQHLCRSPAYTNVPSAVYLSAPVQTLKRHRNHCKPHQRLEISWYESWYIELPSSRCRELERCRVCQANHHQLNERWKTAPSFVLPKAARRY